LAHGAQLAAATDAEALPRGHSAHVALPAADEVPAAQASHATALAAAARYPASQLLQAVLRSVVA
jgi:hypothetical protein